MSSVKNGKKKDIKIILLGILVGLVVCGAGIYGMVSSRIASHEYKNSTDIREVSAVVGYCREVVNKDKDEDGYHRERKLREYRVKVTFEIDGEIYQDRDTVYCWNDEEINTGDEIDVEVYAGQRSPGILVLLCSYYPWGRFCSDLHSRDVQERTGKR